jgi:hypothetical protein
MRIVHGVAIDDGGGDFFHLEVMMALTERGQGDRTKWVLKEANRTVVAILVDRLGDTFAHMVGVAF